MGGLDSIDYVIGVVIAALVLVEKWQDNDFDSIKRFFRKLWILVRRSSWKKLPFVVVNKATNYLEFLSTLSKHLLVDRYYFYFCEILFAVVIFVEGRYVINGFTFWLYILFIGILTLKGIWSLKPSYVEYLEDAWAKEENNYLKRISNRTNFEVVEDYKFQIFNETICASYNTLRKVEAWLNIGPFILGLIFLYLVFSFGLPSSLNQATIIVLLLAPYATTALFSVFQTTAILIVGRYVTKFFGFPLIFLGALLGTLLTVIAAQIGFDLGGQHRFVLTYRMLTVNYIFDLLTLFITFVILDIIRSSDKLFKLIFLILIDIIFASVFAMLSLYLGLLFTKAALSPLEVFRILIGKDITGVGYYFGSYFWVMHTTFIPTVLYLLAILACYLLKITYKPSEHILKKLKLHSNPISIFNCFLVLINAIRKLLIFLLMTRK